MKWFDPFYWETEKTYAIDNFETLYQRFQESLDAASFDKYKVFFNKIFFLLALPLCSSLQIVFSIYVLCFVFYLIISENTLIIIIPIYFKNNIHSFRLVKSGLDSENMSLQTCESMRLIWRKILKFKKLSIQISYCSQSLLCV